MGEALATPNPIYGQGQTGAALAAENLDRALAAHDISNRNWALRTQRAITSAYCPIWKTALTEDQRWIPIGDRPLLARIKHIFSNWVFRVATHDPVVAEAFLKVLHLKASEYSLAHPRILWRLIKVAFATSRTGENNPGVSP